MPRSGRRALLVNFCGIRDGTIVVLVALCWMLSAGVLWAENMNSAAAPLKEIRFAAVHGMYPNVSRKDGRMALELLMQKTIIQQSYRYSVKLFFIDPEDDLADAIQSGGYHFVTLSSIDYFKHRRTVPLAPILIPSKIDQHTEHLSFLVAKDRTLSSLGKMAERSLIIESGASGDLSLIWLDTLLLGRGFPSVRAFFTEIRRVNKPGRAILPVFFNQAEACVATGSALGVMSELNPQIGRQVKSLYQSEGLVRLMICATDKPSPKEVEILIRESTKIDKNPDTRQAMTILQMKRFLPIDPEDLSATEKLLLRHEKITAGTIK